MQHDATGDGAIPSVALARRLVIRSSIATAAWLALAAALVAAAAAVLVAVLAGDAPGFVALLAPAIAWCGAWTGLPPVVVWRHRRRILAAASAPSPSERAMATRLVRVRLRWSAQGVTGVELAGLAPTAGARFVESGAPPVLHLVAVALVLVVVVLAAVVGV
ncbi:hypothetical protein GCM10009846_31070 [Agrococcus versicolor]|uniref:Sensor histidine kinase n=1 Tax=Agrococcus versicolor TaxID=501482 RepID=A0ABP5MV16_9MICO